MGRYFLQGCVVFCQLAVLAVSPASPADMLPTTVPAATPVYRWSGLYVGAHVGGAWTANANATATPLPSALLFGNAPLSFDTKASGVIGGGQIGYNWEFAPRWVLGAEADFSGSNLRGEASTGAIPTVGIPGVPVSAGSSASMSRDLDWFGTVRGRFGYGWDRWLLYATGGFAYGHIQYAGAEFYPTTANFVTSFDRIQTGWTVGGGFEYALPSSWGSWTVRGEYLYVDLAGANSVAGPSSIVPPGPPPGRFVDYNWDPTKLHLLRLGLNYKFGWGTR